MMIDVKYEHAPYKQEEGTEKKQEPVPERTKTWIGELIFSHEQIRLMAKHMIFAMSFLYGFESAFFMALCTFANACLSSDALYMIEVMVAFTFAFNYGVYRGWRSMKNRLVVLQNTNDLNKNIQDLQHEQVRLRLVIDNIEKHMAYKNTQRLNDEQIEQLHNNERKEQTQQQQQQQQPHDNIFTVSPISDGGSQPGSVPIAPQDPPPPPPLPLVSNQNTPFNTPDGPTPTSSPKHAIVAHTRTSPIPIHAERRLVKKKEQNLDAEYKNADYKNTANKNTENKNDVADSLTYTPAFHDTRPYKSIARVQEVDHKTTTTTTNTEAPQLQSNAMRRIFEETEILTARLAEHIQHTTQHPTNDDQEDDD